MSEFSKAKDKLKSFFRRKKIKDRIRAELDKELLELSDDAIKEIVRDVFPDMDDIEVAQEAMRWRKVAERVIDKLF